MLTSDALKLTSPLVTRLIIEQLILAYTYHQAEASGTSLDGLEQPRSVGYGIGLAAGLFAMEFTGALFEYQSAQIAAVQGCCLRAAVSTVKEFWYPTNDAGGRPDLAKIDVSGYLTALPKRNRSSKGACLGSPVRR